MSSLKAMIASAFIMLVVTHPVSGQQSSIEWIDDSEDGVATAQESSLPILFLILPPSDAPEMDTSKATESLSDPEVVRIARQNFVPVRLRKSASAEVLLKRLGAEDAEVSSIVVATPRGRGIDVIGAGDAQDPERLKSKLTEAFEKYQARVLKESVTPVLENEDSRREALLESLRLVRRLDLSAADEATAKLLDRKKLADPVRAATYTTLAKLSTDKAVDALLEGAMKDTKASDALRSCTPKGAASLQSALNLKDRKKLILVYDAVVAICSIDQAKPAEFWQGKDKKSQQAEIDRVKALVSDCTQSSPKTKNDRE